jgi:hypothetical protein
LYNRTERRTAIPVLESIVGTEMDSNNLTDDSVSNIIPISMTLPRLHEPTTAQMVNIAGIGRNIKARSLVHQMSPSSGEKMFHTQLEPGIAAAILRKHTETIADTGILICNACRVFEGKFILHIMRGDANAKNTLGSVYQLSRNSPVIMGYRFISVKLSR